MRTVTPEEGKPWWKFGHVWLVISGPAVVVVASAITVYLALSRPEQLVTEDYYQRGRDINKTQAGEASMQPAVQGRNHAATGGAAASKRAWGQP